MPSEAVETFRTEIRKIPSDANGIEINCDLYCIPCGMKQEYTEEYHWLVREPWETAGVGRCCECGEEFVFSIEGDEVAGL